MSQDLVSLVFTEAELAEIDAALTTLETRFAGLIALTPDERRSLRRMGTISEPFCRRTLLGMQQNPQLIPPNIDLAGGMQDLATLDALAPRLARLQRLNERADDTEAALGSDIMVLCTDGYRLLDIAGKAQGLDGLRSELSVRFRRKRAKKTEPEPGSGT
jgi:hypothetical protein